MADNEIDTVDKAPTNNTANTSNTNNSYYYDPRYGPLARVNTAGTQLPAFASELQPGLHRPGPVEQQKIGNPAPLGLAAFALTTFCLGCINMGARDITEPNIVVGVAYGYGGLVQLCAGMWYVYRSIRGMYVDDANDAGKWLLVTLSVLLRSRLMVDSGSRLLSRLLPVVSMSCRRSRKRAVVRRICSMIPLVYS